MSKYRRFSEVTKTRSRTGEWEGPTFRQGGQERQGHLRRHLVSETTVCRPRERASRQREPQGRLLCFKVRIKVLMPERERKEG